jgi:hypothetical protein
MSYFLCLQVFPPRTPPQYCLLRLRLLSCFFCLLCLFVCCLRRELRCFIILGSLTKILLLYPFLFLWQFSRTSQCGRRTSPNYFWIPLKSQYLIWWYQEWKICHGLYFHSHFPKLFVNYFSFQDLYSNRFEHRNHPNNCPHRHFLLVSRNSWICFFCLFSLYPHQELFHRFAAQVDRA